MAVRRLSDLDPRPGPKHKVLGLNVTPVAVLQCACGSLLTIATHGRATPCAACQRRYTIVGLEFDLVKHRQQFPDSTAVPGVAVAIAVEEPTIMPAGLIQS